MFTDYLFLSSDSLSAKSVAQGIDIASQKYDEYPTWMPWMFGVLPRFNICESVVRLDKIDFFLLPENKRRFQTE